MTAIKAHRGVQPRAAVPTQARRWDRSFQMMPHHTLDLLRGLLVRYGYWAVAATLLLENLGLPVPGETVLLLASVLAFAERDLGLGWIILVGTVATTVGSSLGYAVGYHGGRPLLERYRQVFHVGDSAMRRSEELFGRYGALTIFLARFVFGLRVVAGPMAGVLRMPWKKFGFFNFLGAALWVTVISLVGYSFGSRWHVLMHFMKRFDLALLAAFVLLAAVLWWRNRQREALGSNRVS